VSNIENLPPDLHHNLFGDLPNDIINKFTPSDWALVPDVFKKAIAVARELPDTDEADKALRLLYYCVCDENSRRLQQKTNKRMFGKK
jgi:hypothetical protein